jgi:excinuclease ABC subunit A
MPEKMIIVRGARQHNLKNIDLELPRNKLVVITGLSGSGKSTLAFDTLYAEGQRRYVESLSTYARQFLERMQKPAVDLIDGLSPAIAIEQKTASHNPRSTVGTVTEIYDYLRLLFARAGTVHCHICGRRIVAQSLDQIIDRIMALPKGMRMIILAPLITAKKGGHQQLLNRLRREGFARIRVDGETVEIEEVRKLDSRRRHTIEVIIDRLIVKDKIGNRLADSLELALAQSGGIVIIDIQSPTGDTDPETILFNEKATCTACGTSYPEFTPASFSFNSPQGACPACDGLGATTEFDRELIVPNPELSLRDGAVALWANRNSVQFMEFLEGLTRHFRADIHTPFKDLPARLQDVIFFGSGEEKITFHFDDNNRRVPYRKTYEGLIPLLQRRFRETESSQSREEIRHYMNFRPCSVCNGTKLKPESLSVRIGGASIHAVSALSISGALDFFSKLRLTGKKKLIAGKILQEITQRLGFLEKVGLSYLTLDRSAATLSGGESQRIRLATQIGSKLTGVLYVLDEPSIGLHQRDNQKLLQSLIEMRDLGNSVLVVEHDDETIRASDYVVDMGPGAGMHGGEVVFSGKPEDLLQDKVSLTGQYMSGRRRIEVPSTRRSGNGSSIIIQGARANNLKSIRVAFPLGCFVCVTGVSGSGKSTLVLTTLHRALIQRLHHVRITAGVHDGIKGLAHIDKVVHIDQSPIGRTPRSNPGTYTGVFNHIREAFSKTPDARMRGYKPGRFSFNVKGGRCEACRGDGIIKIEMHFLPDVYVPCDVCQGKRYNRETLEIRYKGKNIAQVLDMTVNQCLAFFERLTNIRTKLQSLVDVGLG